MGAFGRNEWAFMGTGCTVIQQLTSDIAEALADKKVVYVDAEHKASGKDGGLSPFDSLLTDKIDFWQADFRAFNAPWVRQAHFTGHNLILINGNHFEGLRQVIFLDSRKFESLGRKTDRLKDVALFLSDPRDPHFRTPDQLPDLLKQAIPGFAQIPVLNLSDTKAIAAFISENCSEPRINGLLLVGGRSTRMGRDKAQLQYHGTPQWQHSRQLLQNCGIQDVYLSCRSDQAGEYPGMLQIHDSFTGLGPMGGILSAFRQEPDAAWLVLACDLPFMDEINVRALIQARNSNYCATAFRQPETEGFPEPLVAIWEPAIYPLMLLALGAGYSCPRKVLLNTPTLLIDAPDPRALTNVNTPEEKRLTGMSND